MLTDCNGDPRFYILSNSQGDPVWDYCLVDSNAGTIMEGSNNDLLNDICDLLNEGRMLSVTKKKI